LVGWLVYWLIGWLVEKKKLAQISLGDKMIIKFYKNLLEYFENFTAKSSV